MTITSKSQALDIVRENGGWIIGLTIHVEHYALNQFIEAAIEYLIKEHNYTVK